VKKASDGRLSRGQITGNMTGRHCQSFEKKDPLRLGQFSFLWAASAGKPDTNESEISLILFETCGSGPFFVALISNLIAAPFFR